MNYPVFALTYFSPSHRELYDKFLAPSFEKHAATQLDTNLMVEQTEEQHCPSGEFRSDGWMKAVYQKIPRILKTMNSIPDRSWLIFLDADICLYDGFAEKIKELVESSEAQNIGKQTFIYAQDDVNMLCSGFLVMKNNDWVREYFRRIQEKMETLNNFGTKDEKNHVCDQLAFNSVRKEMCIGDHQNAVAALPRITFFNYRHLFDYDRVWDGFESIRLTAPVLNQMVMHHANYCIGVQSKMKMLWMIQNQKEPSNVA